MTLVLSKLKTNWRIADHMALSWCTVVVFFMNLAAAVLTDPNRVSRAIVAEGLDDSKPTEKEIAILKWNQEPRFDNSTPSHVTVILGKTAYLPCRVLNLGERALAWYRKKDYAILASGIITYTNDRRFTVTHVPQTEMWNLVIDETRLEDNGTYECQMATGKGVMSRLIDLTVVQPEAFILGSKEYHVDKGSRISLVCVIEQSPSPPKIVSWFRNGKQLMADDSRISITLDSGQRTQSRLVLSDAGDGDSGNYTCRAENAKPASIVVFVSGDKTAAIQPKVYGHASTITMAHGGSLCWWLSWVFLPLILR